MRSDDCQFGQVGREAAEEVAVAAVEEAAAEAEAEAEEEH